MSEVSSELPPMKDPEKSTFRLRWRLTLISSALVTVFRTEIVLFRLNGLVGRTAICIALEL